MKSKIKIENFDPEPVKILAGGMFHLWCCDCRLRHTVFVDKEGDYVKIGMVRDETATQLARREDKVVVYRRSGNTSKDKKS